MPPWLINPLTGAPDTEELCHKQKKSKVNHPSLHSPNHDGRTSKDLRPNQRVSGALSPAQIRKRNTHQCTLTLEHTHERVIYQRCEGLGFNQIQEISQILTNFSGEHKDMCVFDSFLKKTQKQNNAGN